MGEETPPTLMKLLLLCPSRGRSARITETIESFEKTADLEHTRLQVLLDRDDPQVSAYHKILPPWVQVKVFDRKYDTTLTTEILNRAFKQDNEYEFYSVTNDDMVYLTPGWDQKLCNKGKISTGIEENIIKKYGEDYVSPIPIKGFPQTSVIDGDICRALGWVQLPTLRHSAGDNVWYWIGQRLGILDIHEDVRYLHKTKMLDAGVADEIYDKTNPKTNIDDYYVYKDWLKYKINKDLDKIRAKVELNPEFIPPQDFSKFVRKGVQHGRFNTIHR